LQQTVHKQELTDRQNECLQLFHLTKSTEDATYEWYKDRVQDRVEGTCNWFLQHSNFQRWLNQVSGPLLVSADPGCGKSVLAKYLVNHVLPASATVCYFFFKDQDQNTARQALCALLHQLFSQKPCLLKHAMEQYKQNGKGLIHSTNSLWTILGEAIQDSQAGPIIIVLDALDECAESELEALMHEIENQSRDTQSSRGALRFLMTSRPYEQIIQRFRGLLKSFPHIHIPGEEESDTISDEVNRVIKFRVEQLTEIQNLTANIQADLLDALLKIEHRTYLWVHLVFDYLESKGFKKTRAGVESATKTLPKTVNQAYEKILDKSEKRSIVRKALTIILAAKGALTLSELNIAMEIGPAMHSAQELDLERDEDFKIRLRWLCGLFVSVHHGKVYFLHQTAREFLMGTLSIPTAVPQEMRWHHSITMQDAHKVLAEQCLRYIHLFDCTPELAIHTTRYDHPCHGIYALLHYAAACWPMHFREARLLSTSKDSVVSHLGLIVSDPKSVHFPVWYTKCQTSRDRRLSSSLPHLTVVCFLGHDVLVKTFLDNNADVNAQDAIHGNALQAASEEGHEQIVDMLLDRGAEINVTTKGGVYSNALQAASYRGHRHIVEMLLNRGADVNINARSRYHTNALQAASERGHKQIVELLLDRGANVNAQGGYYSNALQAASKAGHEQIVEILLDRGAEVNAQDGRFGHALQAASYGGHEQIVKLLLDRGADIHAQDGVLGDALQAASMKRHDQIAEMLLNRGALQPKRKEDCVDN
jgi:ankyrin repeat protein